MAQNHNDTTPVGRLVRGSLYKGNTTDAEGKPLVTKTGPNTGQPRTDFFFAVAIPKGGERGWWETPWGQKIMAVGAAAFPQAYQSPSFAWKITDGDSAIPNKKGRKPCDNEGYPGHWVLGFSSGFKPKVYKMREGTTDQCDPLPQEDFVKLGYYVQVNFNCGGNGSQTQPGIFMNHSMVCFIAFGKEISVGPDASSAGFGAHGALPAGASMTPPAGAFGAVAPGLGQPQMQAPGMGMPQMQAPGMGMPQMQAPAAPLLPGFGMPQMQAAAPATPQYQMAPQAVAQGMTREGLNAQGYSDEAIVAAGYMTRMPDAPAGLPQMQAPAMGMPQMGAPAGLPQMQAPAMGMPQMQAPGQPMPLAPGFSAPGAAGYAAPIAGAPGVQIPVTPNPGFLQIPAGGMMAAPAQPQLTPKAFQMGATSWQDFINQGWSEQAARAQGLIA